MCVWTGEGLEGTGRVGGAGLQRPLRGAVRAATSSGGQAPCCQAPVQVVHLPSHSNPKPGAKEMFHPFSSPALHGNKLLCLLVQKKWGGGDFFI